MRNEALSGYLLHQRPYQEKRALYYLFSQQHGVIHGVGKKGAPLFEPLQLFATGKRELKTFSQMNIAPVIDIAVVDTVMNTQSKRYSQISGQQQYAALYLNELLLKLLPIEDPMPELWRSYQNSLLQLKQPLTADALRLCLRLFERHLFKELGFALTLTHDNTSEAIDAEGAYRFLPDVGFVAVAQPEHTSETPLSAVFQGGEILSVMHMEITTATLGLWSRLHRHFIDHLLDYQPLQSRLLWQQQQRYQ